MEFSDTGGSSLCSYLNSSNEWAWYEYNAFLDEDGILTGECLTDIELPDPSINRHLVAGIGLE